MKKMKSAVVSMLIAGAVGFSASASAEGELDGTWFNTRIKTTFKKDHGFFASGSYIKFNGSPIQFDSGKDSCFSALNWRGAGTRQYDLIVICEGTGGFEVDGVASLIEVDGGSVGNYITQIAFPERGQSLYPSFNHGALYFGALYLKASFKKSGQLKTVKLLQPTDGFILFEDISTAVTIASSRPSLKMKLVDISKVPAGADACLNSALGTGPALPNC
ncbi:MAG: hypothetical protein ACU85E_17835 [Gammaproteobacteria bacterium]